MKKRYLLLIIPVIVIVIVLVLNKKAKNFSIKEAKYDSAYSKLAINILKSKMNDETITNYEDGNKGEMYAFYHEKTNQVSENTDYRYIGKNPNNYMYFNCSDLDDTSTCEVWRIIGIFPFKNYETGDFEYKIKIMRDEYIGEYAYDLNGKTDWSRATLKDYLNNDYYNSLSSSSQNMIIDTTYYLGPMGYEELVPYEEFYKRERNNYYNQSGNEYTGYSSSWTGKIALPYPSDYYYGGSWMHTSGNMSLLNREEFIPNGNMHYIVNDAGSFYHSEPTLANNIKPVAYLNDNLFITSGNGSRDNPYMIMSNTDYQNQNYEFKIGDEVYYNNELYHVIDYSTFDSDYVAVLKDVPLTEKYTKINNEDNIDKIGYMPFDKNKNCYYESKIKNDYSGCTNNYDKSNIKSFLNKWVNDEFNNDDLVSVDGNKVRLITKDEVINGFKVESELVFEISHSYEKINTTDESPDFFKNSNYSCWTMDKYEDSNKIVIYGKTFNNRVPYETACVQPVLNFKKSSIGNINEYNIGDEIKYKDIDYYVISDSSPKIDYVTVIRKSPLTEMQMLKYTDVVDTSNTVGRSIYMKINYNLPVSYENSDAKKIVDSWIEKNFDDDDLSVVDGYKGRLISVDELLEKFYYDYYSFSVNSSKYKELKKTDSTPDWIYNYSYWTETSKEDNGNAIFVVTNYGSVLTENMTSKSTIRPVIYLKKSAIGNISSKYKANEEEIEKNDNKTKVSEKKCTPKYKKETITNYSNYNVGDEINYKDEKYYVIRNSDNTKNYVTILKDGLFKDKEYNNNNIKESIKHYFKSQYSINDSIKNIEFYTTEQCKVGNQSDCRNDYESSIIKKIIDNWINIEFDENDLINVDGYKARIITRKDLENLGFTFYNNTGHNLIENEDNLYSWLYNNNFCFWGMSKMDDSSRNILNFCNNHSRVELEVYYSSSIKPIIYLNKSVLGSKTDYVIGEEVKYENELYNVLENTDSSKNYIVLLKQKPLTEKQINNYKDLNYDELYNNFLNKPYIVPFYNNENCNNDNKTECKNDYESSNVKKIIDKWIKDKDIEKDLILVDGYKARLLNGIDLFDNLGYTDEEYHNYSGEKNIYAVNNNVPEWIYNNNFKYWTMVSSDASYWNSGNQISNFSMYIILENGYIGSQYIDSNDYVNVYDKYAIRPVLNLNKCAIEGGCTTEEIEIQDGCMEDDTTLVDVPSTLSFISKIVLIISGILIISGCSIFVLSYYKSKKERN